MHTSPDDWGCFAPPLNATHISQSVFVQNVCSLLTMVTHVYKVGHAYYYFFFFYLNVCDLIYLLVYPQGLG